MEMSDGLKVFLTFAGLILFVCGCVLVSAWVDRQWQQMNKKK